MRLPSLRRWTFAGQFLSFGLVVLIIGMITIGIWVQSEIKQVFIARSADTTALFVDSFVAYHVQDLGDSGVLDPAGVANLENHLGETSLGQELVTVKLWTRDGTVAYSTDEELIGLVFPVSEDLRRSFNGTVISRLSDLTGPGHERERQVADVLIETHAPVSLIGSDKAVAVVEFYQRPDSLLADIGRAQQRGWFIIALATATMYLMLVGLARGASRLIATQRTELEGNVQRLSGLLDRNRELQSRMRAAAGRATTLTEQHLHRISADLHDGPAQNLALAMLRIEALEGGADQTTDPPDLATIGPALDNALADIRSIAKGLRLPELSRLSLSETSHRAIKAYERATGTTVTTQIGALPDDAPLSIKITVYRVLQEALANGIKHAPGAPQYVEISASSGDLFLSVADKGPGISPDAPPRPGALGLQGMKERVNMLGGTFELISSPGQGMNVHICLPIHGATDE